MDRPQLDYARPARPAAGRLRRDAAGRAALGIAGVAMCLVATGFGLVVWVMTAPAVPRSSLVRLNAGMSAGQVTQLLGAPDSTTVDPDGSQTWTYSRMTWAYLTIDFDAGQTVTAVSHDD